MNIIDWWEQLTDMRRIPFMEEHWYVLLLPWGILVAIGWIHSIINGGVSSNYIHVTGDKTTCTTCCHYISSDNHCCKHSCQIYSPHSKTCGWYQKG